MILVGITGPIGHGKSTLLSALQQAAASSQAGESSLLISQVAEHLNRSLGTMPTLPQPDNLVTVKQWLDTALPAALTAVTSVPFNASDLLLNTDGIKYHPEQYEKLWDYLAAVSSDQNLIANTITPANKAAYRPFLQWIGGYVTLQLGYSLWYKELVQQAQAAAQSGCQLYIIGGVRFPEDARVIREAGGSLIEIVRPAFAVQDIHDPTEQQRNQINTDIQVLNNGSLTQLTALATALLLDLKKGKTSRQYQAQAY